MTCEQMAITFGELSQGVLEPSHLLFVNEPVIRSLLVARNIFE